MVTKRTVPSGGAMHPYETYLLISNVEGLEPGLYRYLAIEHKLLIEKIDITNISEQIVDVCPPLLDITPILPGLKAICGRSDEPMNPPNPPSDAFPGLTTPAEPGPIKRTPSLFAWPNISRVS